MKWFLWTASHCIEEVRARDSKVHGRCISRMSALTLTLACALCVWLWLVPRKSTHNHSVRLARGLSKKIERTSHFFSGGNARRKPNFNFWELLLDFLVDNFDYANKTIFMERKRFSEKVTTLSCFLFWPRGFADAVLGTAYLLFLLENFFEFHEKSGHSLHC